MPRRQLTGTIAVGATVVTTLWWLAWSPGSGSGARLAAVAAALTAHAAVIVVGRRPGALSRAAVTAGIVVVLIGAVAFPPRDSNDVWGYVSYARVLTEHHENPYRTPPAEFADDPMVDRMSAEYRSTPTIYGPVFTTISAGGSLAAGDSPLANRVFFQLLALGAAAGCLVLVHRRSAGRDPTALAYLGLSPVVVAIVNGAHTDLLIGLCVLAAVMTADRRRPAVVGVLLATAALIKLVALAPAAAVVVWCWRRYGPRAGVIAGAVTGVLVASAYLVVGGLAALEPVRDGRLQAARSQAWEILRTRWSDALAADGVRDAADLAHADIARVAAPLVVLVLVLALWRLSRDRDPAVPAVGAGLAYLFVAPYVLPWYSGWVLPSAASSWRRGVAVLAQAQAAVVFMVYADPPGRLPPEGPLLELSTRYLPLVGVGLTLSFVAWCVLARPDRSDRLDEPVADPDGVDHDGWTDQASSIS
jgi:alpha-1,6-mannosyltransferase